MATHSSKGPHCLTFAICILVLCFNFTKLAAVKVGQAELDPCVGIAGKIWVAPQDVKACFASFQVDPVIKANILDVVNKTLAFHTSVNYQIQAPEPFAADVHEDLLRDLTRISSQSYPSDFDFHVDLSRTLKRLNDGHCVYVNRCYDSLYLTYLPTPLVLLTDSEGFQNIYIAPEAFSVASAEFKDQIDVWQNALPEKLMGRLSSLSGAKVWLINGQDPFLAVNASASITGGFQSHATRQNSFFASYYSASTGWAYSMGDFAQQPLPLNNAVNMTIQRVNSSEIDTISLPYRSRFSPTSTKFANSTSFRKRNCVATAFTNGYDAYGNASYASAEPSRQPVFHFQQQPLISATDRYRHINVMLNNIPLSDIVLPSTLQPAIPLLTGSYSVAKFYMLKDNITGILALGSFSASKFETLQRSLLTGLVALRKAGATQLIVDVTNNGGGFVCIAHWLHRIIIGPGDSTEPQAGLDSKSRAGPLPQLISKQVQGGADPDGYLLYNPTRWTNATHQPFPEGTDWLQPLTNVTINGHMDTFSQRIGQECQPFSQQPPDEAMFMANQVVIISNGRCASSCSLFSITMAKKDGVKTIVVGGKSNISQQCCGSVGGRSADFSTMDTEIKTTHLKNHVLAPPDFLTNSVQGITWRLGYGIDDPAEPEEWQNHLADINMPLTPTIVNNPVRIWEEVAATIWTHEAPLGFQVQLVN